MGKCPNHTDRIRINQILRRSLLVGDKDDPRQPYSLLCRDVPTLVTLIDWLCNHDPSLDHYQQFVIPRLKFLGDHSFEEIRADPELNATLQEIQPYLHVMQVDLPEREGRTKSARRSMPDILPAEKVTLFGIPLHAKTEKGVAYLDMLKRQGLRECNIAHVGKMDMTVDVCRARLIQQDNLRELDGRI